MSGEGKDWKSWREKSKREGGEGKVAVTVRKKARVSLWVKTVAEEELTREKEK